MTGKFNSLKRKRFKAKQNLKQRQLWKVTAHIVHGSDFGKGNSYAR